MLKETSEAYQSIVTTQLTVRVGLYMSYDKQRESDACNIQVKADYSAGLICSKCRENDIESTIKRIRVCMSHLQCSRLN